MALVVAVGEIQPYHVDAGLYEGADFFGGIGGRTQGGHDLGAAEHHIPPGSQKVDCLPYY
jgi:hypothetical protein